MFMLDNKPLSPDTAFTASGIQYPANWLRLASAEEKAALGITEVDDAPAYDDRFYWGVNNPKDIDQLKAQHTKAVNEAVWKTLLPTDFMDSRKANDPTYEAPADWLAWRDQVRSTAAAAKAAIAAATSVEQLIAVVQVNWPAAPDAVAA